MIIPSSKYPTQIDTTDLVGYPQGKAKNDVVPGDQAGTPLERDWVNDLFGFFQASVSEGSVTPSGTPEKVGASDVLTALKKIAKTIAETELNITARTAAVSAILAPGFTSNSATFCPIMGSSRPQWIYLGATSVGYRGDISQYSNGFATVTVPNFATGTSSRWSGTSSRTGDVALVVIDSSSSTATRLARYSASAWATADLLAAYSGPARAAYCCTGSNNGGFVVAQGNGTIYRSTTGATGSWSATSALPANTDYRHLDIEANNWKSGGAIWIGCRATGDSPNGYILRSADGGLNWSAALMPGTSPIVCGVCWDERGSRFLAAGTQNGNPAVWSSSDGTSWTLVLNLAGNLSTENGFAVSDFNKGITHVGGVYISGQGNANSLVVSRDLLNWRYVPAPMSSSGQIFHSEHRFTHSSPSDVFSSAVFS